MYTPKYLYIFNQLPTLTTICNRRERYETTSPNPLGGSTNSTVEGRIYIYIYTIYICLYVRKYIYIYMHCPPVHSTLYT